MRLATILKATASIGLTGLIFYWIGPAALLESLRSVRPARMSLIVLLSAMFILARSWKWAVVARAEIPDLPYRRGVSSLVGGMGLGMVTPARAGEFSRAFFLPEGDWITLVGLFTFDRIVDLLTIVAFGVAAAYAVGHTGPAVLGAVAVVGGVVGVYGLSHGLRWLSPWTARFGSKVPIDRLAAGAERLGAARVTSTLVRSLLATAIGYVQFYVILDGFVPVRFEVAAFAFSAMILSNLLPISIAGLGVREWVSVLLLGEYGVSDAIAVNAAFLSYLLNTVAPGLVGALLVSRAGGTTPKRE
jgi:uncharacterized membrane protein YbhN (UPF0104 family)